MTATTLAEESTSAHPPRYDLPSWRRDYGVVAGITGRGGEPGRGFDLGLWSEAPVGEVMTRWRAFQRSVPGFSTVVLGNQIHGTEVSTAPPAAVGWIRIEGIDGWVTTDPGLLLTVTVADCVPVYLVVPRKGVGLLHAGWRGTAGGILARGVERLTSLAKASSGDIIMHCGVAICGDCYEVGSEVMAGCGVAADGAGPWRLDLRQVLTEQAARLGLRTVTVSPHCSAHHPDFFSHRASRGADGRMVAYLGMPSSPAASPPRA